MDNEEMLYDSLDYDPSVVEAIRELKSGYNAGGFNRIYKLMDVSESYKIRVSSTEPVKKRLFHDVVRGILICNLLAELFNGPQLALKVYDSLEDVKADVILLCEDYINFFNAQFITHPKHAKIIEFFQHIIECLIRETRVDIEKAFELLE